MSNWIDLHAVWRIALVGLVAGAGLPALFAVGLRALGPAPAASGDSRGAAGVAIAGACFAVVLFAIGWGVYLIVEGT